MAGSRWKRLSGDIAVSTEHDFVRRVRPFLRVLWPTLTETPQRKHWDSFGIDLVEWSDAGPFPTVVQCKGWHVQEIGRDQARLVDGSVDSFLDSGFSCDHFVIVHNRDGRFDAFNDPVRASLQRLVVAGVAKRVSLIDRQQLLSQVRQTLDREWAGGVRDAAIRRLSRSPNLFGAEEYLEDVPFERGTIRIKRLEPSIIENAPTDSRGSVAKILLRSTGLSWTIVEGPFGSGKTTASLHAAQSRDRTVVFVACADLPPTGNISLNDVLVQGVRDLPLWDRLNDDERSILEPLAADSAVRLLSDVAAADQYLLLLDGLDEHRAFYSLSRFQRLLNQLIDIECPVVLTTRSEHFATLFDTYTSSFAELSWKFKPDVPIPLLRLKAWSKDDSIALIRRIAKRAPSDKSTRLDELATLVTSGDAERHYGAMPYNPLMLRFIIDDVADRGIDDADRALLIDRWARRKLWRDITSHPFIAAGDVGETVRLLMSASEHIASRMTEQTTDGVRLTESLNLQEVRDIVASETPFEVVDVLTNAFLMPIRSKEGTRVVFALRVLHEFFLAASLLRNREADVTMFPAEVAHLYRELTALRDGN